MLITAPASTATLAVRQDSSITTNLPLTTIFTPSASCIGFGDNDVRFGLMNAGTAEGQPSAFRDFSAAISTCYPPNYSTLELNQNLLFSPGVCPYGYVNAYQTPTSVDGHPSATLAYCCPSGMGHSAPANGARHYCSTQINSETSIDASGGQILTSGFMALQWPISVMWDQGDLKSFTPVSAPVIQAASTSATSDTSSTRTKTNTALPTFFTSSTSTASATHTRKAHNGGLSTAAQAGIGVAIGLAALAAIVLGVLLFLRRRRKTKNNTTSNDEKDGQPYVGTKAELPAEEMQRHIPLTDIKRKPEEAHELEPQVDGLHEAEEQNRVIAELEGDHGAAEARDIKSPDGPGHARGQSEVELAGRKGSRERLVDHDR